MTQHRGLSALLLDDLGMSESMLEVKNVGNINKTKYTLFLTNRPVKFVFKGEEGGVWGGGVKTFISVGS